MLLKIRKLNDAAIIPYRAHDIDVGLDCPVPEDGILQPGPNKIPLGWACEVPIGYTAAMYPRTGMASGTATLDMQIVGSAFNEAICKIHAVKDYYANGISIIALPPPIDPGYTGEVHAIIYNASEFSIRYKRGARFSQLVCHPIAYAVPTLEIDTSRAANAFGSSGV